MKNNFRSFIFFIFVFVLSFIVFSLGYNLFLKSIYPIKYESIVNSLSKEYNIEPELIYAVIKSESGFDENAVSSAGALGLMQITPETFSWLQTYNKEPQIMQSSKLFSPEVNIKYGTLFLSILKKRYPSEELVLCAYNAGMNITDRWIKDKKISEFGESVKNIPYKETRNYISKIKKSKEMYKLLYF